MSRPVTGLDMHPLSVESSDSDSNFPTPFASINAISLLHTLTLTD